MTEYSKEEAAYRDSLITSIENIMKDLNDLLHEPEKPELKVIKGEG